MHSDIALFILKVAAVFSFILAIDVADQFQRRRGPFHALWCRRAARRVWR